MNFNIETNKDYEFFIDELISTFPKIREEVLDEDWIGLIHLQVGCFTRYTQKAIDDNNISAALNCFQFVEERLNKVQFEIENALVISWMTKLDFTKNERLYNLISPDFKYLRKTFEDHYNNPSKKEKLNSFLKDLNGNPG